MARTTRSSVVQNDKSTPDKDKPLNASPPLHKGKQLSKKRKRASNADAEDGPNAKHAREDEGVEVDDIKEEDTEAVQYPPLAGDVPLKDDDAQKILDILEMVDTIGLLDRVFPLDEEVLGTSSSTTPSSSKNISSTFSLRALLKDSHEHPLRVLRHAVNQLFPISSHPRSKSSPTAEQQLRFCQLALSLLDQASTHTVDGLSLPIELILPSDEPSSSRKVDTDVPKRRKYALMQKLPTGEWWTSLNADLPGTELNPLKDLGTGYAELVAVLPSPPPSVKAPTLGEFYVGKKPVPKAKLPQPRKVSCATYLDYGPYTSFAPVYDSEGAGVGRFGLSSVLWQKHEKSVMRMKAKILAERMREKLALKRSDTMDVDGDVEEEYSQVDEDGARQKEREKQKELLSSIASPEEADTILTSMDKLELEQRIGEFLSCNAKALLRLEELQRRRIGGENGGASDVQEGSEEHTIALRIIDSLAVLASLRPRLQLSTKSAIIPPPTLLRTLSMILPAEIAPGWYGTLSDAQPTALRDDTTIQVKAGTVAQTPAPVPAPAPAPPPVQTPSTPYSTVPTPSPYTQSNYSYSNFSQQYRNTTYQQGPTPASQPTYSAPYTTSQTYPYGGWYQSYQPPVAAGTASSGTTSGRGTPQPTAAVPTGYAGYGGAPPLTAPTPARAVANTIAGKVQPNGWSAANGAASYTAPTLPLHLRPGPSASPSNSRTPGVPGYAAAQTYTVAHQHAPAASS